MNIPFVDLQSQYKMLKEDVDAAVLAVMQRGDFVLGGAVADFERVFADYCGAKYCVGVDSGYSALELIVRCLLYTSPSPRDRTRSRMPSSA